MLTNATDTLAQFAPQRIQSRRPVRLTLNPHRTTDASIAVVASTARTNVAIQVMGLKVPTSKTLWTTWPGRNSQTRPRAGISTIPAAVDTAFITTLTTAARFQDKPKSPNHKASHSTISPVVIGRTLRSRFSSTKAGQTTSAYVGVNDETIRTLTKMVPHRRPARTSACGAIIPLLARGVFQAIITPRASSFAG